MIKMHSNLFQKLIIKPKLEVNKVNKLNQTIKHTILPAK